MMERNEEDEADNQVQLMTMHASKGLRVPICIYGWYGRRFTAASIEY